VHASFALSEGGNGMNFSIIAAAVVHDVVFKGRSKAADLYRVDRDSVG
jgi:hypothetical protein